MERAAPDRTETRSGRAPIAELFAGRLLEELDSFSEGRSKIFRGTCFAVDGRCTKADRKHEGGRHR